MPSHAGMCPARVVTARRLLTFWAGAGVSACVLAISLQPDLFQLPHPDPHAAPSACIMFPGLRRDRGLALLVSLQHVWALACLLLPQGKDETLISRDVALERQNQSCAMR